MTELGSPVLLEFSSVFHLMSGLAYVEKLRRKGEICQLYLHYACYWKNQSLNDHYITLAKDMGASFLESEDFRSLQKKLLKKKHPHILLKINTAINNPLKEQRVVEIDDGVGAYRTDFISKARIIFNEYSKMKKEPFHRAAKIVIKLGVKEILSRLFPAEHFGILLKGNRSYAPNREYSTLLRAILEKSVSLKKLTQCSEKSSTPYLLFLSAPAVQIGWYEEASYKRMLEQLSIWAIEKHGAHLAIKKHPADEYDYSNYCHVDFNGIAEELFAAHRPIAVISIYSTAALTAKIVFDIPSYIISPPFLSKLNIIDASLQEIFSSYTESITIR